MIIMQKFRHYSNSLQCFFVGELMGNLKHSEELKEQILAEIATGVPMTQLSEKYDIPMLFL